MGWLTGWFLKRNLESCLAAVTEHTLSTQTEMARFVLQRIDDTDPIIDLSADRLAQIAAEAMTARHRAIDQGARSERDPLWCAATIVETWANAQLGHFQGRISTRTAEHIHARVQAFVFGTLNAR
jgi:hypothetical protein